MNAQAAQSTKAPRHLQIENLNVRYGGIHAVRDLSLHADDGELVALIGANGAGKTSTLKALARQIPSSATRMTYGETDLAHLAAYNVVRHGVALVPEGRAVFTRLSVEENLDIGAYSRPIGEVAAKRDQVYQLLPRLAERRTQLAGTLSGGEQQMLAIGRALMSEPKLLLLDEPSMGLAPLMVQKIFEVIHAVSGVGVTILLVEQNALLALKSSVRAYVLEGGAVTLSGPSKDLLHDARVQASYLGG